MHPKLARTIAGGFAGTVVMTGMMYFVAPMILGKPMDVAGMLASMLGESRAVGMLMHLMLGSVVFPVVYTYLLFRRLPGEPWLRGSMWGLALWVVSQAIVTPMMGGGLFSANAGGPMAVMASFIAHAAYGALLGGIAGVAEERPASSHVRAAA